MPHPIQSLVNSWIKVNTKHVIFPRNEGNGERPPPENANRGSLTSKHASPQRKKLGRQIEEEHVSHDTAKTTPSTTADVDPEALAISRMDTRRQNRRGLRRTVSHSDLLRELAKEKGKAVADGDMDDEAKNKADNDLLTQKPPTNESLESQNDKSGDKKARSQQTYQSLLRPAPQLISKRQQTAATTGKYLNEAVFVQQMEQARAQHQRAASAEASSADGRRTRSQDYRSEDRGVQKFERRDGVQDLLDDSAFFASTTSRVSGGGEGPHSEPGPVVSRTQMQYHRPAHTMTPYPPVERKSGCSSCEELEQRLQATLLDLEYLRSVAVRTEFTCKASEDPKGTRLRPNALRSKASSPDEASKRLVEVATSHRRQIEQMTKERSRWRTDMQVKLSKITMICKELNEENGIRKQAAASLESELQVVRDERNVLASEVEQLRAQIGLYEREEIEFRQLQEMTASYETGVLDSADEGIRQRNSVTADLSNRMERAMDTLETERAQQRQRRQIIFPVQRSAQSNDARGHSTVSNEVAALKAEVTRIRESARETEKLLASTILDADRNETALRTKCETLEKQLRAS